MSKLLTYAKENSSRSGILVASRYLTDVASCLSGGACPNNLDPEHNWESLLKDAGSKLTVSYPNWGFKNIKQSDEDGYILTAVGVMSTSKEDSDKDVLEPKGCELEPRMPFLWHHMVMQPVGKVLNGKTSDSDVRIKVGIMDIGNGLGRDTAKLIELDALRISHGFEPIAAKPRKGGGWHVTKYRTFEASGVTLPANTDAIFLAYEKSQFKNDLMKDYIKGHYDARRKVWKGIDLPAKPAEVPEVVETPDTTEKTTKHYLPGSWEFIESALYRQVRGYLTDNGVDMTDEDWATIDGTYADYVIARANIGAEEYYYRINWTGDSGEPELTGDPEPVKLNVEITVTGVSGTDEDEKDRDVKEINDAPTVLSLLGI